MDFPLPKCVPEGNHRDSRLSFTMTHRIFLVFFEGMTGGHEMIREETNMLTAFDPDWSVVYRP